MEPATPVVLEYSVPTEGERRWGPVLFRPSWVAVLLFLLTCAIFAWLLFRHQPWRLVATLPCDYQDSPHRRYGLHATFTPDGLLLFDTTHGAGLYDPVTGTLLRTILPTLDRERYHYYGFTGSRHILAFPNVEGDRKGGPAALYDFEGKQIARFLGLGRDDNQVVISPISPTVLYRDRQHIRLPLVVHDLTGTSKEVRLYRPDIAHSDFRLQDLRFSPDGTRVMVSHWAMPDSETCYMDVFDLRMGKNIGQPFRRIDRNDFAADHGFTTSNEIWFAARGESDRKSVVEFYTLDGKLCRRVMVTANLMGDLTLSDDGTLIACSDFRSRPGLTVEIRDTLTGNIVANRPTVIGKPLFFPGSRRFLTGHPSAQQHVIADQHHDQPLAVLPEGSMPRFATRLVISPDGRTIVAGADPARRTVVIYRKAGWDCPESHLGAFAFPNVWLLFILFAGTVFVATGDARRARVDTPSPPPRCLPNTLILLSLLPTLHFLLAGALGRWTLNPAPLILLAAVGLLTHSRFWRLACVIILAGTLGWSLYLLNTLRPAGIAGSTSWLVLDREYLIPRLLPSIGLAFTVLLCIAALFLLVRRRQMVTHGA